MLTSFFLCCTVTPQAAHGCLRNERGKGREAAFHTLNLHNTEVFLPPSKYFFFLAVYLPPKQKTLLSQPESFSVESPPSASE